MILVWKIHRMLRPFGSCSIRQSDGSWRLSTSLGRGPNQTERWSQLKLAGLRLSRALASQAGQRGADGFRTLRSL